MSKRMVNWLKKCVPCLIPAESSKVEPIGETSTVRDDGRIVLNPLTLADDDNPSLWRYDLVRGRDCYCHAASAKAYNSPSSSCTFRVENIDGGIIVCICDSHGSSDQCAAFVQARMTEDVMVEAGGIATMSDDALREAFQRTEAAWVEVVNGDFIQNRLVAASGTSCLVGVIAGENIFLANVGDSRSIVATINQQNNTVPEQLTIDDNINDPTVRATILIDHPGELDFLVQDVDGIYHIKGRSQLTKSIGDMYLKLEEFNIDDQQNYRLNTPLRSAAVSAIPNIRIRAIQAEDQFMIFASKELWNIMNHQEALFIVRTYPQGNRAATLIRHALAIVANQHNITYSELQQITNGNVIYHNDLAVAVIFLNEAGENTGSGVDVSSFSTELGSTFESGSARTEVTSYFTALEDWEVDDNIDEVLIDPDTDDENGQ